MVEVMKAFEHRGHEVVRCIMGGEEPGGHAQAPGSASLKEKLKTVIPPVLWKTTKDLNLKRFDRYAAQTLEEMVRKEKPDLIYERGFYLTTSGAQVAAKMGIKYIVELNAPYPEEARAMESASLLEPFAHRAERKMVECAHRIVVVSSALKDYLENKYQSLRGKVLVTPNAVNFDLITQDLEQQKNLRQSLGFSSADLVIGFVGSIFPYHGVDRLIKVFAQLREAGHQQLRLLIVGDGQMLDELRHMAEELGLAGAVVFTGKVDRSVVFDHIALMDITIAAASGWYMSPIKVFEYGALEKPIIAPNSIPMRDVMESGKDGLLVEPDDEALYNGLKLLIDQPEQRSRMASSFHQKVRNKHTWQHVGDQILNEV